jgi:N-acetylmuramic acid 6-phosphate etherase
MVVGLIAGGETAIRSAVENAEDDDTAAEASLRRLALSESAPKSALRCRRS